MPRILDMTAYPRRAHFDYFRSLPYPYVGVTVDVDVTEFVTWCRREGRAFFLSMVHAAALAADTVPEMRRRIRDGGIIEYEECPTSHTELLEDGTYAYCTLRHHMSMAAYDAQAEEARRGCRENGIEEDEDVESMYFISSLPWLHYTSLIQPVAGGDESNPRLTWGRYEEKGGRLMLPFSVLVHHALADGLHIARFFEALEEQLRLMREGGREA